MKKIKISSISLKTTPLDFQGNLNRILQTLSERELDESAIVLFPELCISGYGCEDAFYNPYVWKKSLGSLMHLIPYSKGRILILGLPIYLSPYLYNCSVVLHNSKIIGIVPKVHLANTGVHYEARWFRGGYIGDTEINILGSTVPFGNLYFSSEEFSFGIEICEDSWVPDKPSNHYSSLGADIIFSMGASHFSFRKQKIRKNLFRENSRSQNNVHIYSNLNGNESGKIIFEGGCLIFQNGLLLKEGKRLHFTDSEISSATIDLDSIKQNRSKFFRCSTESKSTKKILFSQDLPQSSAPLSKSISETDTDVYTEFSNAVTLGLYDYLVKTHAKGFSLSLSGGADSSACAILVSLMKEKAKSELGSDIFSRLGINEMGLLYTIYQGTKNNSDETRMFARDLARILDLKYFEIDIDSIVDGITEQISDKLSLELSWDKHDLALQNIQARVRSPIVWMMANLQNHLLISTGNRSESSVGYTTMDGDSSGSLCPISGVSKIFILEWLDYIMKGREHKLPNLEILKQLLNRAPTAELKPLSEAQEDEKDLMPYPILQEIEEQYVLHGRDGIEVFEVLKNSLGIDETLLLNYIKKYEVLFKRAQWKRERLPPGFHLDDYGLDPKTSFRYPILSG